MSIIRGSQYNITTIWPELVNKRLNKVDIRVKESQFIKQNEILLVKGLLQRRVCYFDYDNRDRKTEDQLQFEIIIDDAGAVLEVDRLTIELRQHFFIFQPRRIGENQAIFEHGFSIIIHHRDLPPENKVTSDTRLPVISDEIAARGQGKTILSLMAFLPGAGAGASADPNFFNYQVDFESANTPPLVNGVIKGVISYRNLQKLRSETEFEQQFSLSLNILPLKTSERLLITGEIQDINWWFDPAAGKWNFDCQLEYIWRITTQKELLCVIQSNPGPEHCRIKVPVLYQQFYPRIPKRFLIPAGGYHSHELNISRQIFTAMVTKKGILLQIGLWVDIYAVDSSGLEKFYAHEISCEELIAVKFDDNCGPVRIPDHSLAVVSKPGITLPCVQQIDDNLNVEMVVDCQINLYQNRLLAINPGANPNTFILGKALKAQETFTLSGFQVVLLRLRPFLIKKLKVSPIKAKPQVKNGWIQIRGEFELAVSYLDHQHRIREDTFPILFREIFLWDGLQVTDEAELQCQLEHDSYALDPTEPLKLNYRFWLNIVVESFQTRELPVTTVGEEMLASSANNTNYPMIWRTPENPSSDLNTLCRPYTPVYNWCFPDLEVAGESLLNFGKAREIIDGRFQVDDFNYRITAEYMFVEGYLNGELEYWDNEGYLRSERTGFWFWKCLAGNRTQKTPSFEAENGRLIPELKAFRYTPVKAPAWSKGRVHVQFKLELKRMSEEGVL